MTDKGPLTGKTLSNRYELGDRIGIGGMAEVYSAQDLVLGRIVAVKTMLPQYATDPDFTRRFRQEAAAAANLQSPYIVNVYDWGHSDDNYFIVMEFVRGSDLKTAIRERGAIGERKVAEIAAQVCQALSVAHQQDIVHRDVKPQNIMVQPDGNVKVMDFGIARAKNSTADKTEVVLGTAHYTSPEQAQGKELTAASDIYSLGVVMYEAATGQLPFDGPDAVSVALMQVQDQPQPPRSINPSLSPDFESIILTAMQKDPNARFATVNDMRTALTEFLAGRKPNLGAVGGAALGGAAGLAAGAAIGQNMAGATQVITQEPNAQDGFTSARTSVITPSNTGQDATRVMPAQNIGGGIDATQAYGGVNPVNKQGSRTYQTPDNNSNNKQGRGKKIAAGCIIAAIAVIAIVCAVFFLGGEKEEVPDLIGMTSDEAITTIETSGFKVGKVEYINDDSSEAGTVTKQNPKGGTQAKKGSEISISISQGSEMLSVPDVSKMQEAQAKQTLVTAGFTLGKVTEEYSDSVEKGAVISQNPAAGTQANKGTAIDIVKSKGAEEAAVPDLRGLSVSAATQKAESAGFVFSQSSSEYSDSVDEGCIISQSPASGNKAEKGSTISCVVSKGSNNTVSVPDVVGSSESYAKSAISNAGLNVSITQNYSSSVARGNVISQSPSSGSNAKKGDTVTIEVSLGPSPSSGSGGSGGEVDPEAQ